MSEEPDYMIRSGGLMRCCTKTIVEHEEATKGTQREQPLPCKWCSSSMRFRDGCWEWIWPK